ncbi:MAG: hypothetical protein CVU39_18090 [Chloroflexi bacterium HGW-Chloroflexi-10]|nr:MAG: hypothetical protein CVU39_18090 [Chloroflexi bacterium HGW-Chloroflexi-10]
MDRPIAELPVLIAQSGPLDGQRWGIDGELQIGRDPGCDISVPDRQVSRFHARVSYVEGAVLLDDLESKNGTFLNGEPVKNPIFLQDGDVIQIALVQSFYYLSSDATMPLDQHMGPVVEVIDNSKYLLRLDTKSRRVWIGIEEVLPPLSVPQFRLLQELFVNEGDVVSRSDLVSAIWGNDKAVGVSEQALDALIRRLRERLISIDPSHDYLITVRGHGIRLENRMH